LFNPAATEFGVSFSLMAVNSPIFLKFAKRKLSLQFLLKNVEMDKLYLKNQPILSNS
jgi:hypothetical protein